MLAALSIAPTATADAEQTGCPSVSIAVEADAISAAQAFAAMDDAAFEAAHADLLRHIACLGEPITPAAAASAHRAVGLAAFMQQDDEAAILAFQAAQAADPEQVFDPQLAPPGGELAMTWERARAREALGYTLLVAQDGSSLWFDGALSARMPHGLPVVLQLLDPRERPTWSGYLGPGDPWPEAVERAPVSYSPPRERSTFQALWSDSPVLPLASAGALAAGALAMGLKAGERRGAWRSAEAHCEERFGGCSAATDQAIEDARGRAMALGLAAGAAASGSLALGMVVVVRW